MRIYLFHLINNFNLGGSTTYLIHLVEQMKQMGYDPVVIKRGKKERVTYYYHIPVNHLSDEKILFIAKNNPSLITYCFWNENGDLAQKILRYNIPLVVHDPSEFHDDWMNIAKKLNNTIVIREKNKYNLRELGIVSHFIPHPYISSNVYGRKTKEAVCAARIDFRKHTHIVCQYNDTYNNPIDMYGEINRMYDYHILKVKHPNWKDNYHGIIEPVFHRQAEIISTYQYAIDLTAIKKDGGGTQYCFFEAWDTDCILILNKKWDCENSILKDKMNCLFVDDHIGIHKIISNRIKYDTSETKNIIKKHSSDNIIPQYLNVMK